MALPNIITEYSKADILTCFGRSLDSCKWQRRPDQACGENKKHVANRWKNILCRFYAEKKVQFKSFLLLKLI